MTADADRIAAEHAAMLAERNAIIDALDVRGSHTSLLWEVVEAVAEARVARELREQVRAYTAAVIESAQRGWMQASEARQILNAPSPSTVTADVRAIGEQERRDLARGAARERAGWVAAIGVCQAFAALRGGR